MSTKYVAKTGSNSNNGDTVGTPYLTISYAITQIISGDTIEVAVGTYSENLNTASKTITFNASGAVILDGTVGSLLAPAINIVITANQTVTFQQKPSTSGTWTIQNYVGTTLITDTSSVVRSIVLNNVNFISNGNSYALYLGSGTSTTTITNCAFTGFLVSAIYSSSTITMNYNTFTNNYTTANTMGIASFNYNTVTNSYKGYYVGIGGQFTAGGNVYTDCFMWHSYNGLYNFATWKTLGVGYDISSTSNTPGLYWYVNKSGSNSNTGYGPSNAKLTISGACSVGAAADNILVGAGLYNERVVGGTRNFYADGIVTVDGTGLLGNVTLFSINGGASVSLSLQPYTSGGQWILKNNTGDTLLYWSPTSGSATLTIKNCTFQYSTGNINAVNTYAGGGQSAALNMSNCIINGAFSYGVNNSNGGIGLASSYVYNTFYGCTTAIYFVSAHATNIRNNIFSNITTAWNQTIALTSTLTAFGNQYYSITNWKSVANTYTSIEQVQAAGFEAGSIVADPNFTDAANGVFFLKSISTLGQNIGAYPYGFTCGAANDVGTLWNVTAIANNTGWYNSDGNITKDGVTGFFILSSGTSGALTSPVFDLGIINNIYQVDLEAMQLFPTNVIDSTNADIKPNVNTIHIRASTSTFTQDDAVISWSEGRYNMLLATALLGRYVQIKLTFLANGVAG